MCGESTLQNIKLSEIQTEAFHSYLFNSLEDISIDIPPKRGRTFVAAVIALQAAVEDKTVLILNGTKHKPRAGNQSVMLKNSEYITIKNKNEQIDISLKKTSGMIIDTYYDGIVSIVNKPDIIIVDDADCADQEKLEAMLSLFRECKKIIRLGVCRK